MKAQLIARKRREEKTRRRIKLTRSLGSLVQNPNSLSSKIQIP